MKRAPWQYRVATLIVLILLALGTTAVQAAIPASERTVLLNLYTSTNGGSWTTSTNWNGPAGTECTWFRVTCNGGGTTVTSIDLHTNNLTGTLPANLSTLTNLSFFNATNNQLTGPIPALTGLTNLVEFWVHTNQLTGSIPALTGLTNLGQFQVGGNQLTGNVPSVPSPDVLLAGGSGVCPNFLNYTPDPAWDAATGVTPWYTNCAAAPTKRSNSDLERMDADGAHVSLASRGGAYCARAAALTQVGGQLEKN